MLSWGWMFSLTISCRREELVGFSYLLCRTSSKKQLVVQFKLWISMQCSWRYKGFQCLGQAKIKNFVSKRIKQRKAELLSEFKHFQNNSGEIRGCIIDFYFEEDVVRIWTIYSTSLESCFHKLSLWKWIYFFL